MLKSFYVHIDVLQFVSRDQFYAKSNVSNLICISYKSSWTNTNYFPLQPKNWHNSTTVHFTLSMYVTPKTISRPSQKSNTTPQLYCTLVPTWVCKPKPISHQNQKLTQHNSTTGKKVPPAHAKRVYSFLCQSVRPSVSKGFPLRAKRVE